MFANCFYLSSRRILEREDDPNNLLPSLAGSLLLIVEESIVIFAKMSEVKIRYLVILRIQLTTQVHFQEHHTVL